MLPVFLQVNYTTSSIIGLIVNPLLMFLILRRSPTNLRTYKPILLVASITDGWCVVVQGLSQLEFQSMNDTNFAFVTGLSRYLPATAQVFVYIFVTFNMIMEILVLLLEFYFRHQFLKTKNVMSTKCLLGLVLIALVVCFVQVPLITFYWPSIVRYRKDSNEWWPEDNPSVIIVSKDAVTDDILKWLGVYRSVVSLSAFFLTCFVAILSVHTMNKEVTNMSKKTKQLLSQFTNTLIVRIILFGSANVLPLVITQIANTFKLGTLSFTNFFITLYIWLPILNTISTLLFIQPFRRILVTAFRSCLNVLTLQHPQTSITRVQTMT
ncbi:hypothetical protein M3Y95_01202900 [Aphelenchoides besseyi]|nr:hypothetical protein M3Y95_01202900 [Aphelenchoides besseyi]